MHQNISTAWPSHFYRGVGAGKSRPGAGSLRPRHSNNRSTADLEPHVTGRVLPVGCLARCCQIREVGTPTLFGSRSLSPTAQGGGILCLQTTPIRFPDTVTHEQTKNKALRTLAFAQDHAVRTRPARRLLGSGDGALVSAPSRRAPPPPRE